ncbi:MAG: hypothetical protein H6Q89_386, partial [Myxococcaceae bacterium]|nr:hypothetical protein [Myxococcaceae bacterium]
MTDPAGRSYQRLEQLYELSNLFASFENVAQTLDPALGIIARTLPLRSAILIAAEGDRSRMSVWTSETQSAQQM